MRPAILLAAVLLPLPLAAAETPPPELPPPQVLDCVPRALAFLDGDGFVGSYHLNVRAVADAPGEDDDEDEIEELLVTVHPDGTKESRLLRAVEHGRDVTAERLRKDREHDAKQAADSHEIELDGFGELPFGSHRSLYAFEQPRIEDGLAVAAFAPLREHRGRDGMARGRIAWDPRTLRLAWVEIEPNERPTFVDEMTMRLDLADVAGTLYPSRFVTRVRAGLPLIFKVKVDVEITVTDVEPAPGHGAGAVPPRGRDRAEGAPERPQDG